MAQQGICREGEQFRTHQQGLMGVGPGTQTIYRNWSFCFQTLLGQGARQDMGS